MDLDVVVCAKNRAALLERVLKQIIREIPFRDLIVIYGSSTDGTREVAERYTKSVFWDGDKGLGAARNLGIRKAGSELVAMIDTDVVLTKDWCKRLVRHFENNRVAAVMGATIYGYGYRPIQQKLVEINSSIFLQFKHTQSSMRGVKLRFILSRIFKVTMASINSLNQLQLE